MSAEDYSEPPIDDIPPPLDADDTTDFFASIPRGTARRGKSSGREDLAAGLAKAKAQAADREAQQLREQQRAIPSYTDDSLTKARRREFTIAHSFTVLIFLWIAIVHACGIYLFTTGFLLTRTVLESKSTCDDLPITDGIRLDRGDGCWYPKSFDRAVVVIIDALRYDFAIPYNTTEPPYYHNAFHTLYNTARDQPSNAFMGAFIADPPTTTLQRLKGLTTGTLPTFVDAGTNFAGTAIEEDNLIAQLKKQGKKLALLGDDTWTAIYPGYFDVEHAYESLNVWDLHTVDNGVMEHIFPLLEPQNATKWDVLIGHLLGVDHAGHRYGPDHPAMKSKLEQMDVFVQDLINKIDDETLLVVMGDHGMDPKGDHGGESELELVSTLWMYSRKGIFGHDNAIHVPPRNRQERQFRQIDLVPTLALLLGIPIPFNNLGAPIKEAFVGTTGDDLKTLAEVSRLTSGQIERYYKEYTGNLSSLGENSREGKLWDVASQQWSSYGTSASAWRARTSAFHDFQQEILGICQSMWAEFDVTSMQLGVTIMLAAILCLVIYARGFDGDMGNLSGRLSAGLALGGASGAGLAYAISRLGLNNEITTGHLVVFASSLGSILAFLAISASQFSRIHSVLPDSLFGILSMVFTLTQAAMFAANSWTIWEDRILTLFLGTFGFFALLSSFKQDDLTTRALGIYHAMFFIVLTRTASFIRLCREEQMPYCESTFYASASSSVSSPYSLGILFLLAIFFPLIVKSYYNGTKSHEGPAIMYIDVSLRLGLFLTALYWTVDSADNGNWVDVSTDKLKSIRMTIAQVVLAMSLLAGNLGFGWMKMCLGVQMVESEPLSAAETAPASRMLTKDEQVNGAKPKTVKKMILLGYANLHGSRYFLLVLTWYIGLSLLQKPLGGTSLAILILQILTLLEIIDCNNLSLSSIGPVVLGMLGSSHFFSTGHQATLQSVQWEAAFIPVDKIVYPWSPLLVLGNTYGAQILTAIAVPAIALWKQPAKQPGLLSNVIRASATFLLYHAVVSTSTVIWAGWLRRHLMLYKIFAPRFLVGGTVLLTVDLVVALIAVFALRWNVLAVGELFGIT